MARVSIPFLGWGTDFLDYDNDGWLDLLVVNGHVYPAADRLPWNTSYAQRALLFRNLGPPRHAARATFEDVGEAAGPALTTPRVARGSAIGDLDNDGDIDLVVNNIDDRPTAGGQRGRRTQPGHWLTVRADGRSGAEVSAGRDRLGGLRHRRRRAAACRSGERPRPDLAVGSARRTSASAARRS